MSTSTQVPTANDLASKASATATKAQEGVGARAQQELDSLKATSQEHKGRTGEAVDKLEHDLKETTDAAVEEGKEDVTTYLQQALPIADYGLSTAESYINAGKEKLAGPPAAHDKPATGFTATLASTGLAALDVAHRGIGMAHETLHHKGGQFPHAHSPHEPAHPVTVPAQPIGETLSETAAAAQDAVQPHLDNAKATAQPYTEKATAVAQPHVEAAKPYVASAQEAAKPYVDAVAAQANAAASGLQQQVNAAKGAVQETNASEKPLTTQATEVAADATTRTREVLGAMNAKAQDAMAAPASTSTTERTADSSSTLKPIVAAESHASQPEMGGLLPSSGPEPTVATGKDMQKL